MLPTQRIHRTHDLVVTLLIALAAALLVLMMIGTASGIAVDDADRPGMLPANIDDWANPLTGQIKAGETALAQDPEQVYQAAVAACTAISYQEIGNYEQAVAIWEMTQLPPQQDVWRWLAMAEGYRHLGRLDEANILLEHAVYWHPENAYAWYLKGLVYSDFRDTGTCVPLATWSGRQVTMALDASTSHGVLSNPYDEASALALLHARQPGSSYNPYLPLMGVEVCYPPAGDMAMPVISPTVGELIASLGHEDFPTDAQLRLEGLGRDRSDIGTNIAQVNPIK